MDEFKARREYRSLNCYCSAQHVCWFRALQWANAPWCASCWKVPYNLRLPQPKYSALWGCWESVVFSPGKCSTIPERVNYEAGYAPWFGLGPSFIRPGPPLSCRDLRIAWGNLCPSNRCGITILPGSCRPEFSDNCLIQARSLPALKSTLVWRGPCEYTTTRTFWLLW